MKGSRPEQAYLSNDTDLSKTEETRAVIEGMVDGLNDHRIDDIGDIGSVGKKEEEETFVGIESKTSSAFATPAPCFRLKNTPSTETYTKRNAEE